MGLFFSPLKENQMKERAMPWCRGGLGDFLGEQFHWQQLGTQQHYDFAKAI